jgi:transcriptional activator of cad operon
MAVSDTRPFRIADWRVDPALDEIAKDGKTLKLEPRTMRVLLYLAKNAGQVVSVEQLLDAVWKDVVVTEDSVYQAVAILRRALGDDPREPRYIANVLRRGYRLVTPVVPWVDSESVPGVDFSAVAANGGQTPRTVSLTTAVSDKSIAVLPFADMSENKDQGYFADGMAKEVVNLLMKVPGIRVIGRTACSRFKGKNEDLRTIGSVLGATYAVEGSVRRSGNRLRVTAQLIGTQDGRPSGPGATIRISTRCLKFRIRSPPALFAHYRWRLGVICHRARYSKVPWGTTCISADVTHLIASTKPGLRARQLTLNKRSRSTPQRYALPNLSLWSTYTSPNGDPHRPGRASSAHGCRASAYLNSTQVPAWRTPNSPSYTPYTTGTGPQLPTKFSELLLLIPATPGFL